MRRADRSASRRLGQVTPISLVLVTGVIISLVGAAYIWGVPIIEKRSTVTDFGIATAFMDDLDLRIREIANAGAGQAVLRIPTGSMKVNTTANALILEFPSSHTLAVLDSPTPIRSNLPVDVQQGVFGASDPRVLSFETRRAGIGFLNVYTLRYIDLVTDGGDTFTIVLAALDTDAVGSDSIIISFDRSEVVGIQHRTYITIEVV